MATMASRPDALVIGSLAIGVVLALAPGQTLACEGCGQSLAGSGGRRYGRVVFCARCSTAYLQAWASGQRWHPAQFVRERRAE
jgi:hypothetical protein